MTSPLSSSPRQSRLATALFVTLSVTLPVVHAETAIVARGNSQAPGQPAGVQVGGNFTTPIINDAGQSAFRFDFDRHRRHHVQRQRHLAGRHAHHP